MCHQILKMNMISLLFSKLLENVENYKKIIASFLLDQEFNFFSLYIADSLYTWTSVTSFSLSLITRATCNDGYYAQYTYKVTHRSR